MEFNKLPKQRKIRISIAIFSFCICALSNAPSGHAKNAGSKNSSTILQKIKEFCKQHSSKRSKKNKGLNGLEICLCEGAATDDDGSISTQSDQKKGVATIPVIDDSPYANFWAYDLFNKTGHNVNLTPYLQQANIQINNVSPTRATKNPTLPNYSNPLNDVAADPLLEELLDVHTFIKPTHPKQPLWANFSFDFSIGTGLVLYSNYLEQMRLVQRQKQDYFFITKSNEVYKPNWFHDTLNKVIDFDQSDDIEASDSENATFQGKGWGLPITLGIQYVFWQHLLMGVGREIVFNATHQLAHNDNHIAHKTYTIDKRWSTQGRWFAKCGWYALSNETYRLFGDIRLSYVDHLGSMFPMLVNFSPYTYLHKAVAYNFGLGYEQQLTSYLSYTTRFSIELQEFKQFSNTECYDYNIRYKQTAFYLQVGLSIRLSKSQPEHVKNKSSYDDKLNGISKLEGLQDLLGLD